jgi:hypothetical protein
MLATAAAVTPTMTSAAQTLRGETRYTPYSRPSSAPALSAGFRHNVQSAAAFKYAIEQTGDFGPYERQSVVERCKDATLLPPNMVWWQRKRARTIRFRANGKTPQPAISPTGLSDAR